MKRFATSALLAGALFAGVIGSAGVASATEINIGPNGAGITAADGGGVGVGPNGVTIWGPDDYRYRNHYDGRYGRDYGRDYDRYYGSHPGMVNPCYPNYCVR